MKNEEGNMSNDTEGTEDSRKNDDSWKNDEVITFYLLYIKTSWPVVRRKL